MNKKPFILIITSLVLFSTNVYSKDISINNNSMYSIDSLKTNANKAASDGEYKKAAFLFEQLVKKLPNDEELKLKLGYVLFMNKDYKAAADQFIKVAKTSKNPNYVNYAKKQLNEILAIVKPKNNTKVFILGIITDQNENDTPSTPDTGKTKITEVENNKDNYLCNKKAPSIFSDGSFARWEKEDLPIKVYIPPVPESFNVKDSNDSYANTVKYSMQKWSEKAPKFISFKYVSNPSEANINITWQDSFKDETTWGLSSGPHYISEMKRRETVIYLPVRAQAGTASYSNEAVLFSQEELSWIIVHETGHALGLGHSFDETGNTDIMEPYVQSVLPGVKPELTARDINSLNKLYLLPVGAKVKCK